MELNDTASFLEDKFSFTDEELAPIRAALKTKLYKEDEPRDVRDPKWQAMVAQLAAAFGLPETSLEFDLTHAECKEPGFGGYCNESHAIKIGSRYSLVTVLHYFALAVLHARIQDPEFKAMVVSTGLSSYCFLSAVSLSLFKGAAPKMFAAAKASGKLMAFSAPTHTEERRSGGQEFEDEDEDDDSPEPAPGHQIADVDPENRVDRGNGIGED